MGIQNGAAAGQGRESVEQRQFDPLPGVRRAHAGISLQARASVESCDRRWQWPCVSCAEVLLRGSRFISAPFFRRNKPHARAEALVIAWGLAGVFEHRVAAGPMTARAHLPCLFGGYCRCATGCNVNRSSVLWFLAGHSSSLYVCPMAVVAPQGFRFSLSHPPTRITKRPGLKGGSVFRAYSMRGISPPLFCASVPVTTTHSSL